MNFFSFIIYFAIFAVAWFAFSFLSPEIEQDEPEPQKVMVQIVLPTATSTPLGQIPSKVTQANFNKINLGMKFKDVNAILGDPTNKIHAMDLPGDRIVAFEYVDRNIKSRVVLIQYLNGKVNSMHAVGLD